MPARTDNAIAVEIVSPATSPVLFTIFVLFVISTFRCCYQRHPLHATVSPSLRFALNIAATLFSTTRCLDETLLHSSTTSIPTSKVGVAAAARRQEEVAITRHENHSPPLLSRPLPPKSRYRRLNYPAILSSWSRRLSRRLKSWPRLCRRRLRPPPRSLSPGRRLLLERSR
jgi:hypothetical protein